MAISVHFRHAGFTPEKYDEAIRRLEATGHGAPAGRLDHTAVDVDGEIEVFDIWESPEALEKWGPEGFVPEVRLRRRWPLRTAGRLSAPRRRGPTPARRSQSVNLLAARLEAKDVRDGTVERRFDPNLLTELNDTA
jgi:hypothetical protein